MVHTDLRSVFLSVTQSTRRRFYPPGPQLDWVVRRRSIRFSCAFSDRKRAPDRFGKRRMLRSFDFVPADPTANSLVIFERKKCARRPFCLICRCFVKGHAFFESNNRITGRGCGISTRAPSMQMTATVRLETLFAHCPSTRAAPVRCLRRDILIFGTTVVS